MTMTPSTGYHVEHVTDESCCPDGGHWWLDDSEKAATMARTMLEQYGWSISQATWESPNWHVRAISPYGQIDVMSEHLGACFVHMMKSLQEYGWFDRKYLVKTT